MHDHGVTLRQHLKSQFQPDLLCQAIQIYSTIQISTIDHIDTSLKSACLIGD